ncbi:Formiminotransferase catalytic domain containing protein, partial [Parasponia andersonii]
MDKKKAAVVDQSMLLCCKLFISESRNQSALDAIERAARRDPESVIVNKFEDRAYNRVRYTVVSYVVHDCTGTAVYSPLQQTVVAMTEAAFDAINLETHSGAHPRLGVVDDIMFHPLARASLDEAAWLAKAVARDLGTTFEVPSFLYGAAHEEGRRADAIRRELGYFKPNYSGNQWVGGLNPESLAVKPDEGPVQADPTKGVVVIGATPWVDSFNIPIFSPDLAAVRGIARRVSGRGGGLPSVQAMALAHGETVVEVACYLLDPNKVGGERVQVEVERLAKEEALTVAKGYFTDLSQENI